MVRILGLDPGLQVTGYAVLEATDAGPAVCEAGVIRSAEGRDPADMARRIKALYDGLCEVLDEWQPRRWRSSSFTPTTTTRGRRS